MGKMKIFALLLVSVLLVGMFASCGTEKVIANVTVKVVAGDEILVNDLPVTVEGTAEKLPTVLEAVRLALIEMDLPCEDNDASVLRIGEYAEVDEGDISYFWEYTLNGVLPNSGKAGSNTVKDGDVIVFMYSPFDKTAVK